ncbi:MAG TPA: hypothetical protein DDZ51_08740 [Planctomycetaceae bacterium]|nr:hypothetical protein [Planctomycetaceae bacterium]
MDAIVRLVRLDFYLRAVVAVEIESPTASGVTLKRRLRIRTGPLRRMIRQPRSRRLADSVLF